MKGSNGTTSQLPKKNPSPESRSRSRFSIPLSHTTSISSTLLAPALSLFHSISPLGSLINWFLPSVRPSNYFFSPNIFPVESSPKSIRLCSAAGDTSWRLFYYWYSRSILGRQRAIEGFNIHIQNYPRRPPTHPPVVLSFLSFFLIA